MTEKMVTIDAHSRYRCIQEGLHGQCPACRGPIQQHIRVWSAVPRSVSPSRLLLDTKANVRKACDFLERYPGLDGDFSERMEDLLALCVPKEESVRGLELCPAGALQ